MISSGEFPEIIFWVGCAGSYDERAKKITKAFVEILNKANVSFAVLGNEEGCSGDPAKRAGNEFLFQMQAISNIQVLNSYNIKKIVTSCPHCFNTIKNEYPELGGNYEVLHHTQFISYLIDSKRLIVSGGSFKGKKITYHDPCYLGRANKVFEAPRKLIEKLDAELGAQMFKESEPGNEEVNIARTQQALETSAPIIASGCPFCNTMLSDGIKHKKMEEEVEIMDLAELVNQASNI